MICTSELSAENKVQIKSSALPGQQMYGSFVLITCFQYITTLDVKHRT